MADETRPTAGGSSGEHSGGGERRPPRSGPGGGREGGPGGRKYFRRKKVCKFCTEKIEVIKNNTFVHTVRPKAAKSVFEYRDNDIKPGESYYYVRVEQAAGQLAWSSPIWVEYSK